MSEIDPWDAALNEVAVGMARQAQAVIDEKDQLIASLRDQLKSAQRDRDAWHQQAIDRVADWKKCEEQREAIASRVAALGSHAKWLRVAADEIRAEGHAGWGNTCEQAADAIDSALKEQTP